MAAGDLDTVNYVTKHDLAELEFAFEQNLAKLKTAMLKWIVGLALVHFALLAGIVLKLL